MPRPKSAVPAYRHHKPSGKAVVTVTRPDGRRRDIYLGVYNSPASRAEYARVVAAIASAAAPDAPSARSLVPADLTVNELLVQFIAHARDHYRHPDDGTPTTEYRNYRVLAKAVSGWCGSEVAREFGPLRLKAVRAKMVERGWCRDNVNAQVNRVRRVFKWAASEELVPAVVADALRTVAGLQVGRTAAPERPPVQPVPDEVVAATLPFLTRHVAGLVRLQQATGCRPGEACVLRRADLDTSGPVWVYRPARHKGTWRGRERPISVGPRGQALLAEFPTADPLAFVFSPAASVAEVAAARAAVRRTPRYPSHVRAAAAKRAAEPKRRPRERYTPDAYWTAILKGVRRANRDRVKAGLPALPEWHPNQVRHTVATAVRKGYGLEAAQAVLGHAHASTTELYAEKNQQLAERVAAELG